MLSALTDGSMTNILLCYIFSLSVSHSGAEGSLGEVVRPDQVSYLSKRVSTSRFGICKSLNISLGSEGEIIFLVFFSCPEQLNR